MAEETLTREDFAQIALGVGFGGVIAATSFLLAILEHLAFDPVFNFFLLGFALLFMALIYANSGVALPIYRVFTTIFLSMLAVVVVIGLIVSTNPGLFADDFTAFTVAFIISIYSGMLVDLAQR